MDFAGLLASVARGPDMYVGRCSLLAVAHLLDGYCLAVEHQARPSPLDGWTHWIECGFNISHSAWHWTRILLHTCGSDAEAIAALPGLYGEFEAERGRIGVEGILARHDQKFTDRRGMPKGRVPKTTSTSSPFAESDPTADTTAPSR